MLSMNYSSHWKPKVGRGEKSQNQREKCGTGGWDKEILDQHMKKKPCLQQREKKATKTYKLLSSSGSNWYIFLWLVECAEPHTLLTGAINLDLHDSSLKLIVHAPLSPGVWLTSDKRTQSRHALAKLSHNSDAFGFNFSKLLSIRPTE